MSPSPSCPRLFPPQPNTPPETERAKLWSPPAATWTRGSADRERRCWGESERRPLLPRPSWPLESRPHVYTWPPVEKRNRFVVLNKQMLLDIHISHQRTLSQLFPPQHNEGFTRGSSGTLKRVIDLSNQHNASFIHNIQFSQKRSQVWLTLLFHNI